jgi:hypothetical protein
MANQNDNGFHVKLDGIKFSEESRNRIQTGIQEVLLREVSRMFPDPDSDLKSSAVIFVPPRLWRGIYLRVLDHQQEEAIGVNKGIATAFGGE